MSDAPTWLAPLSATILKNTPIDQQATVGAALNVLSSRLAGGTAAQADAVRNQFTAGTMNAMMGALPAEALAMIPDLSGILANVTDALMGEVEQALAPLQQAADQLRMIADTAWALARTPANAAAALHKAEQLSSLAASLTGLPGVTAAWGVAANNRHLQQLISEQAAQAAKIADSAWGSVQHVLDMIRSRIYDVVGAVSDIAQNAIDSITAVSNQTVAQATSSMQSALATAVNSVLPPAHA